MKTNLFKNNLATIVALFTAMIPLSVEAQSIILSESFDKQGIPAGWTTVDADGDSHDWEFFDNETDGCMASESAHDDGNDNFVAYTPNNYLITPLVEGATKVSYKIGSLGKEDFCAEHYALCASTTGKNESDFQIVKEETLVYSNEKASLEREVNLPAGTRYIAFRHFQSTDLLRILLDDVKVYADKTVLYDLWVNGTQATSANCNNLPNASGTVSYDPSSKTLTLDGATINASGENAGIKSKINELTILVKGNCTITSPNFAAICTEKSYCTINGGKLKLSGKNFGLYLVSEAKITIEGCDIESDGSVGTNNSDAEITINKSTLKAKSKSAYKTVTGIKNLTLNGSSITKPEGAYYDATLKGIALDGQLVSSQVTITRGAGPGIILMEDFESVPDDKYNNQASTTLPAGWTAIDADGDEMNWILFKEGRGGGSCATSSSWNGGSALTPNNYLISPDVSGAERVTFYACAQDKDATGDHFALCASTTSKNENDFQIVQEWTIGASSASASHIQPMTQGQWQAFDIALPSGTKYIAFRHFNCTNNFRVNIDDVTIYGNASVVEHIATDTPVSKHGVYTVSGIRLGRSLKDLPQGVYIVDGQKVVKK